MEAIGLVIYKIIPIWYININKELDMFNPLDFIDYKKSKEFWTSYSSKVSQFWKDWASDVKAMFDK
jgi:hypothetical protein